MRLPASRLAAATVVSAGLVSALTGPAGATAVSPSASWTATTVLDASSLTHAVPGGRAQLKGPDDITAMGNTLFVAFQNGVGSMGEPSSTGNSDSTLVALSPEGRVLGQWDVAGKIDGMAADARHGRIVATVDEDGNSSLYVIHPDAPASAQVQHYQYLPAALPHGGGTDAVSIYHGRILISASAPSAADGPAAYVVDLDRSSLTATATGLFSDSATAVSAISGQPEVLALTDPDSNTVVPRESPRFAGDFMLDSQGDQQAIFVHDAGGPRQSLTVLDLSQSVDDTAFATSHEGAFYATDAVHDSVDVIRGDFAAGQALSVVSPCNANSAPATCTTPNSLGTMDLATGTVSPVLTAGAPLVPHGLLFLGEAESDD